MQQFQSLIQLFRQPCTASLQLSLASRWEEIAAVCTVYVS